MSLKQLKGKIRATLRTNKVTKAMEAVSAVKMRASQQRALSSRPYAEAALSVLSRISGSQEVASHALMQERRENRVLIVLVTSDKGLAGALNSSILKQLDIVLRTKNNASEVFSFVCLGKKGYEYVSRRGFRVHKEFLNMQDGVSLGDMEAVSRITTELFLNQSIDACYVLYTNFKSTFEQEPVLRKILPLTRTSLQSIVQGIVPQKGKFADATKELSRVPTYSIEPSPEDILSVLLPKLVSVMFYHALLEAKASEHSARMVAMKNASDKSKEMAKDLSHEFNGVRQALITREVSEIVGGIEAMNH
jgi:F-type H+-transporting ATPase subunit gamma